MMLFFGATGVAGVQTVEVGIGARVGVGVPNCYPKAGYGRVLNFPSTKIFSTKFFFDKKKIIFFDEIVLSSKS